MAIRILVPCKAFRLGKTRLAPALDPFERGQLCRQMFARTLACAGALDAEVFAVTSDPEVSAVAFAAGVPSLNDGGAGLNEGLEQARARIGGGADRLVILPIDLASCEPEDLHVAIASAADCVLAPDEAETGTNLMVLSARAARILPFQYGIGSFQAHLGMARQQGLSVEIVRRPGLAFDLDTPADLRVFRRAGHALSEASFCLPVAKFD